MSVLGEWWGYYLACSMFTGIAFWRLVGIAIRHRDIKRGWLAYGGSVYRLVPINEERDAQQSALDAALQYGEQTRKAEVRKWIGQGDFDAELARAAMRSAGAMSDTKKAPL